MRRKLGQIARAATKLLKHLDVEDVKEADDGPGDRDLLEALASATPDEDGAEDTVTRSTGRIGRLVVMIESVEAAKDLRSRAHQGRKDEADFARTTGIGGHRGDIAEANWIADAMRIYKVLTNKDPVPGRGGAGNPLTRFLRAAGAPIGIKLSRDWRSRIRAARRKASPR
jgi:hypothetical protein